MNSGPVLIVGQSGQVAKALMRAAWPSNLVPVARGRDSLDLSDDEEATKAVTAGRWAAVVNAAAYTAVDKAESEPQAAFMVNAVGPANLARACAQVGVPLVHISTDYVFDGRKAGAYVETDPVSPLSVYGASKNAGELAVREYLADHVILRTSWVFSETGQNFVKTMLRLGTEREIISVVDDQHGRPTAAVDIAGAIVSIVEQVVGGKSDGFGTFHFAGAMATTWSRFADDIFSLARDRGYQTAPTIRPIPSSDYPTAAERPARSVLDTSKISAVYGIQPRPWILGLGEVLDQLVGKSAEIAR